jgi:hypothetical protein
MLKAGWIAIKMANGETLEAPMEVWLIAMLQQFTDKEQGEIKDKVANIVEQARTGVVLPVAGGLAS